MTNRIDQTLSSLISRKEKALALFLTAGYPALHSAVEIVPNLEKAGADIVELGMPFADPMGDGPVIQHSSITALRNGITVERLFQDIQQIREQSNIPIILMGYINPIMRYGMENFFLDAARSGVDGLILPEVPVEESERFRNYFKMNHLANIMIIAPTTSPERIQAIDAISSGFLYCVSSTGTASNLSSGTHVGFVKRVKSLAKGNPVLAGFGISTSKEAKAMAADADGIVVASALIKRITRGGSPDRFREWVREFKNIIN